MTPNFWTGLFILLGIITICLFDLVMLLLYGSNATISRVIRAWGQEWPLLGPLIAFLAGCLYGHFFW